MKFLMIILSAFVVHPVVFAIGVESQTTPQAQAPYKINLQSAMGLAAQHSYNLKAAQANTNSAQDTSDQAFRAFGPTLSGTANSLWNSTTIDKNTINATQDNLTSQGTLTLTQPLLGLIPLAHALDQKNISLHINQTLEMASKIQASLIGAQYYLNLQLSMQQLAIAEANLTTLQKSKQDAQSLFETGSIYKDDYLRILLQYTQAQQSVFSAKSNLSVAQFSLAQSLGLTNPSLMQVEPQTVSYCESKKFNVPNLEESKQIALNQNQNIKVAEENVKLAEITKTISVDNYLPSLNVVASYTKNFNSSSVPKNNILPANTTSYGFQFSWNIWDWGVRSAQNSALAEQIAHQKYLSEVEKESILNSVVSQYYNIINNLNAVITAKDSVATADEAFNLVSFRFLNGQVTALDLVTAQQNLTTAKADLAQIRFNLDLAWITFQTFLGKNPDI